MSWCNNNSTNESDEDNIDDDNDNNHHEIRAATDKTSSSTTHSHYRVIDLKNNRDQLTRPTNLTCPSCGQLIQLQDQGGIHDLPGLPAGVKFDPSDQEILEHLEAKLLSGTHHDHKLHPLIDEFIPTLEGENGICYTHPEKLPGVSKDGQIRHFFHRPSKAYTTGTRKRRKVHTDVEGNETRWHKTGKTRPIFVNGDVKGFKKILVLYTNYGRQRKPEKTNWVMHQYHFGNSEEEKEGEIVVSKVFYQTQPRQCGTNPNMKIDSKDSYDRKSKNIIRNNNNEHELQLQLQDDSNHARVKNSGFYNHEFYNNPPNFINYDHRNRESPPQLIPNLVVQAGGGPAAFTIQFATSDHSSQGRG